MPIDIQDLPFIDIIIISHDHYDHLDYASIKQLISKTGKFLVPLGVGNHLIGWGVAEENVIELDWWQEIRLGEQTYALTPSQHMSGRRLTDPIIRVTEEAKKKGVDLTTPKIGETIWFTQDDYPKSRWWEEYL